MNRAVRKLLAPPGRYLALLGGTLAVVAATTVSLTIGSDQQAELGVPPHSTGVRSAPADRADAPTPTSTAAHPPAGGTPDAPAAPRRRPTGSSTTGTPATASTSPGTDEPEDLLKRHDPLPDGVPGQVEFFLGGGDVDCSVEEPPGPPFIGGAAPVMEIPTELPLCVYGFNNSEPLSLSIAPPSGPATTTILPPRTDHFSATFRGLPGDPVGPYLVTAEQGKSTATLTFTLSHANAPRLWLAMPSEAPAAGADFDLYLGGFPAQRPTSLHLYEYEAGSYRTSFTVPVDAAGEAHVAIDTKPDDPPGCYGIISPLAYVPGDIAESVFCIT